MAIGLVFHWESFNANIWSGRPVDRQQWRETLKALCGDNQHLIAIDNAQDGSCKPPDDENTTWASFDSLTDLLDDPTYSSWKRVLLEEGSVWEASSVTHTNLKDYTHPAAGENTLYIFGTDSQGLKVASLESGGYLTGHDCISLDDCDYALWALCCAAIVLRERRLSGV